ncbi:MAG: histidine phosphatase family protein [Zoogloeaceae bacterium]|jgi:phosphohistidine phosphatase|nr:histidine phosphatase family protein [Zoogloeaceae bacterium]
MELFLWRHADALPGMPDFERELSPRGHKQARRVAAWLKERAPSGLRLLVSPATRTRQTVAYFHEDERGIQFCPPLYESNSPEKILELFCWPDDNASPTLIVGHQPLIGELADYLLVDVPHPESFRKSALWWLRGEPGQKTAQLVQVVDGDMLKH